MVKNGAEHVPLAKAHAFEEGHLPRLDHAIAPERFALACGGLRPPGCEPF
jgi:hypothetical protein